MLTAQPCQGLCETAQTCPNITRLLQPKLPRPKPIAGSRPNPGHPEFKPCQSFVLACLCETAHTHPNITRLLQPNYRGPNPSLVHGPNCCSPNSIPFCRPKLPRPFQGSPCHRALEGRIMEKRGRPRGRMEGAKARPRGRMRILGWDLAIRGRMVRPRTYSHHTACVATSGWIRSAVTNCCPLTATRQVLN